MSPVTHFLDITGEVCPMTFVRTKLKLETLRRGELLEVRLWGDEPRLNLPRSVSEEGHEVLSMTEEPGGIFRLLVRKNTGDETWPQ